MRWRSAWPTWTRWSPAGCWADRACRSRACARPGRSGSPAVRARCASWGFHRRRCAPRSNTPCAGSSGRPRRKGVCLMRELDIQRAQVEASAGIDRGGAGGLLREIARSHGWFRRAQFDAGFWWAELESNATMDAEYLLMTHFLGARDEAI